MEEQAIELPPMPEPHWAEHFQGTIPLGAFTADQMRAYARAAVLAERERCASVCEAEAEGHRTAFGEHCAAAIRKGA
jgi:hypothetical protein